MEPDGCSTSEDDYISSISPLHEILRGTRAMPTLEQFQGLTSSNSISTPLMNALPIIPESEEGAMFASVDHSTFSYDMDVALLPPIFSPSSILVAPPADMTSSLLANFTVSALEMCTWCYSRTTPCIPW